LRAHGIGLQWGGPGQSWPLLNFQPGDLLSCPKRPGSARSGTFGFKIKGIMRDSPSKENRKFMAKWVGYGVAIGCGIGVIFGNTVLGIGPGVAIGVAIGRSILKSRR
jgi:hypothetical protein